MKNNLPLHHCQVQQPRTTINRLHTLLHTTTLLSLLYYRASSLYVSLPNTPVFPWILVSASELLLSFLWTLGQACRWRPVTRTVFPERLPKDDQLPSIDVFILTADPKKEPPIGVMNTLISAMSLDYPTEKLTVYLSDDGGTPVTLKATREAFKFAKSWVPFCKEYGIETRCPDAYFSDEFVKNDDKEFTEKQQILKLKYQEFKERVEGAGENDDGTCIPQNRPPYIEVISDLTRENEDVNIPDLVYVSREKRLSHPHHFKAGALNAILRVSGALSNAPFILVLDCDMYCNDPSSARQAMCFHLDPDISPSLAFVQFPQTFHNVSKNDLYGGKLKITFNLLWCGLDGLRGPILSGTGFYLKREALFRSGPQEGVNFIQSKLYLDPTNGWLESTALLQDALVLASCTHEENTQWGSKIGFMYHSVVEDYFTGFLLHCKGWKSVYHLPSKPAFLGNTPTNLNDNLFQGSRWSSGLFQVGLSKYCPLTYEIFKVPFLQSLGYGFLAFYALYSLPLLCYGVIPQLYLLKGIPLFPKVSDPWFILFSTAYLSALCQRLIEMISLGESLRVWWNEERMWMIKAITCHFFGFMDVILKSLGIREINFEPTNKAADEEQVMKRYKMDKFDFHGATVLLLPSTTIVLLNLVSFVLGLQRAIMKKSFDAMFGQLFLSFIVLVFSFPVIEGMVVRKDKGCIQGSVILYSVAILIVILSFGTM
ncbi:hypothetical protein GIB67_039584 [Kingdonia uniflora]|uniref:Cellulose synthase-like protein G2 n=1 Tax=Kingdonia uniflora TaxID=39325 RepID=A0A7J7P6G9_9MAGN|nr:hypothetical protein GIB67_039584 [Kingdonia uniflora]